MEKAVVIISIKFHSLLRFLQVCEAERKNEREREREVSHCPALKCTNPQLGFQMCVCAWLHARICLMSEIRDKRAHTDTHRNTHH